MIISYKKKHLTINLALGIIWLINGIVQVAFNDGIKWYDFIWFALALAYFILYFFQKNQKYITINNGIIKENSSFGKKLKINDIRQIKHFAGDYILKTKNQQIIIKTQLIDNNCVIELKSELKKINATWI
ncbi:hypothetical protein [Winogradskyella sp. Asnod2-B02-A]|uniref:hypothetical protein n=1 Tax=Winogradskyella sp. Asnod2-B02-A TaxID=3160583 RepID=UPI00386462A9